MHGQGHWQFAGPFLQPESPQERGGGNLFPAKVVQVRQE